MDIEDSSVGCKEELSFGISNYIHLTDIEVDSLEGTIAAAGSTSCPKDSTELELAVVIARANTTTVTVGHSIVVGLADSRIDLGIVKGSSCLDNSQEDTLVRTEGH